MTKIQRYEMNHKGLPEPDDNGVWVFRKEHDAIVAALQEQVQKLAAENVQLKDIVDGVNSVLYGQGFEVAGWHLNGDLEPLDNWFTDNGWGTPETPATDAVIREISGQAGDVIVKFLEGLTSDECGDSAYIGTVNIVAKLRAGEQP